MNKKNNRRKKFNRDNDEERKQNKTYKLKKRKLKEDHYG